ncbi:MAG: DUF1214 domain-containing protein [Acidimicrobiales bacterium]|nr:DUF1214 domain-containing protein [Acidimicrobiales bacterium]
MEIVNVDNFVRAETSRMFDSVVAQVGLNTWSHAREPVPIDQQHVIRMNRDTLYSTALVDLRDDATITIPDMGERYGSVMVVNEDHHLNRILHAPGRHELTLEEFETSFAVLVARLFVDPADPGDIAAVNAIQDALDVEAGSSGPYAHPDYDPETLDATRALLNQLATGIPDSRGTFGPRGEVDPVRHLVGTAFGWGGLPESEAFYLVEPAPHPPTHHRITFRDVPVDGFWSITIYNEDGFLEANPFDAYSLNGVTSLADDDGSVTIDLSPTNDGFRNHLYVMDGWNYAIRLYRPRPEVLDSTWHAPIPIPVD